MKYTVYNSFLLLHVSSVVKHKYEYGTLLTIPGNILNLINPLCFAQAAMKTKIRDQILSVLAMEITCFKTRPIKECIILDDSPSKTFTLEHNQQIKLNASWIIKHNDLFYPIIICSVIYASSSWEDQLCKVSKLLAISALMVPTPSQSTLIFYVVCCVHMLAMSNYCSRSKQITMASYKPKAFNISQSVIHSVGLHKNLLGENSTPCWEQRPLTFLNGEKVYFYHVNDTQNFLYFQFSMGTGKLEYTQHKFKLQEVGFIWFQ